MIERMIAIWMYFASVGCACSAGSSRCAVVAWICDMPMLQFSPPSRRRRRLEEPQQERLAEPHDVRGVLGRLAADVLAVRDQVDEREDHDPDDVDEVPVET